MTDRTNDIIISGNHLELTDALKSIAQDKFGKLFEHEERIIRIRVDLGFTPNVSKEKEHWARGHIEIRGRDLIATVATEDLYQSIDELVLKLDRMLRRRSRLFRVKRKQTRAVDLDAAIPKAG